MFLTTQTVSIWDFLLNSTMKLQLNLFISVFCAVQSCFIICLLIVLCTLFYSTLNLIIYQQMLMWSDWDITDLVTTSLKRCKECKWVIKSEKWTKTFTLKNDIFIFYVSDISIIWALSLNITLISAWENESKSDWVYWLKTDVNYKESVNIYCVYMSEVLPEQLRHNERYSDNNKIIRSLTYCT